MALYHPLKTGVTGPNGVQQKIVYGKNGEFFTTRWGMPCRVERDGAGWREVDSHTQQVEREQRRKARQASHHSACISDHEPIGGRPCEHIPLGPDPRTGRKSLMWK